MEGGNNAGSLQEKPEKSCKDFTKEEREYLTTNFPKFEEISENIPIITNKRVKKDV